ncbi:hypothetical protein [Paenibacillus sp. cl141a]|uniref:hypothetical protein n=1 Tax=Paenibacillus sp. cl141a TaxID=1761877 RepID=UPI00158738AA|nr:hypothetical protein [Paenibacillus sp. cl141a]
MEYDFNEADGIHLHSVPGTGATVTIDVPAIMGGLAYLPSSRIRLRLAGIGTLWALRIEEAPLRVGVALY